MASRNLFFKSKNNEHFDFVKNVFSRWKLFQNYLYYFLGYFRIFPLPFGNPVLLLDRAPPGTQRFGRVVPLTRAVDRQGFGRRGRRRPRRNVLQYS